MDTNCLWVIMQQVKVLQSHEWCLNELKVTNDISESLLIFQLEKMVRKFDQFPVVNISAIVYLVMSTREKLNSLKRYIWLGSNVSQCRFSSYCLFVEIRNSDIVPYSFEIIRQTLMRFEFTVLIFEIPFFCYLPKLMKWGLVIRVTITLPVDDTIRKSEFH